MPRTLLLSALIASLATPALAADWKPVEQVEHYAISGATGIELYRSIGANGPKAGSGRAIAYTDFKLTWQRDYVPERGGCTLKRARPKLVVTYRLPKPSQKLPAGTAARWKTFIAGVAAHEKVHGQQIVELVRAIEAFSVGLRTENDPACKDIRKVLTARLAELSQEQRAKSRAFDRVELSSGGNVHRLVLALVGG